jgi:hypothetical protein
MIYSITTLLGAIAGGIYARRKDGNRFDIAQYAAVWAVIGFMGGMMATIIIARMV